MPYINVKFHVDDDIERKALELAAMQGRSTARKNGITSLTKAAFLAYVRKYHKSLKDA